MGRYLEAREALERFLSDHFDEASAEMRESAETVRAEVDASVGRVSVDGLPDGASVFVDGEAGPVSRELDPGTHNLAAEVAGYQRWSTTLELAEGADERVSATLEPIDGGGPSGSRVMVIAGGAALGVGVVLAGAAGYGFWLQADAARKSEEEGCDFFAGSGSDPTPECQALEEDEQIGFGVGVGGVVVGGVLVVGGAVLMALGWPQASDGETSFSCAPGIASLGCRGTF